MEEAAREWMLALLEAVESELNGDVGATSAFLKKKDRNATLFYLPDCRKIVEREDEPEDEPEDDDDET